MMTIDQNVKLAAAGDMAAFEELYRSQHRRVFSICLRMIRNWSEAEDVTQDVFVQLFRKIRTFRGEASFATWLHRLTVNQVLMHFRKRSIRKEQTIEDGSTPIQVASGTENPDKMSLIDRLSLEEAMGQLPPGYRAVFILHDVEGYEHQQIGQMLGCAIGTSKSQLHKARMKLRQLLRRQITPQRSPYHSRASSLSFKAQPQLV